MSVWPNTQPAALAGRQGDLVSVSIQVAPRDLESLLEALAYVRFPINPEIYHDAAIVYQYADGHEESESTTLVVFPAYAGQLDEVRRGLQVNGLDPGSVHVTGMWDAIITEQASEPAPVGAPYCASYRVKHLAARSEP